MNINYTKIALVVSAIALLSWFMAILIPPWCNAENPCRLQPSVGHPEAHMTWRCDTIEENPAAEGKP